MRLNLILKTMVLIGLLFAPVQTLLGQQGSQHIVDDTSVADSGSVGTDVPREKVIQSWIEKLDSPRYRDRAQATVELAKLGVRAIDALEKTVLEGESESSDRAIEIFKRHRSSSDAELQAAATESLQRIANNTESAKSAAAKEVLEPEATTRPDDVPNLAPQIPVFPKRDRVNINWHSSITIVKNGKSIRVREDQNGIEVQKDDGKGNTSKSKFKDMEELKAKDPDSFDAYNKAMPNRTMQNRANQVPRGRRGAPQNLNPSFPIPDFPAPNFPVPSFPVPNFPAPNFAIPNFSIPGFPDMGPGFPVTPGVQEPFDHQKFRQELLDQHQKLFDGMNRLQQPGFRRSPPIPNDSLPEDPAPESKQPQKTKVIEPIDV